MIRKAVIPAAGMGTVVDKPVIQYVVEEAIASGIKDILIITGKGKRSIEDHFDKSEIENEFLDEIDEMMDSVNLLYTRQKEPRGLGDAVYYAKSFVGEDAFALLLGDTITIPECTKELITKYDEFKTSIIAVEEVPTEKISSYGIIKGKEVEGDIHLVEDLVEKPSPEEAPSNLGILGRYVLTPAIFDAIEGAPPGKGNEIQLTDALRLVREKIYAYVYSGRRYDIGNKLDWIKSNIELFLRDNRFNNELENFLTSCIENHEE
jgi:UTP--glucose-1-phosphate uridylyltransferase